MLETIRYLLRHKLRTALTILAVAVGIFAVTAVGGIAEQLSILIQLAEQDAVSRIYVWSSRQMLTEASVRQIRRVPGVAGVTLALGGQIDQQSASGFIGFVDTRGFYIGIRSDIPGLEYRPPARVNLQAGRVPAPGSRTETVVSWDLAQKDGLQVGDLLEIREQPFRVVGIWEDTAQPLYAAYISYDAAQDLNEGGFYRIGSISVEPQPGIDLDDLARRIETEVDGTRTRSPSQSARDARQGVLIFSLITGASGAMALLIGTFTIVNTMVVSVHERRREIGLKKALGAADSHVLAEVVAEAAFIGGLGGALGVLAGSGLAFAANQLMLNQAGMPLFLITPRLAVGAIVFTVLMGVIGGLYPAWQAARLDPVAALRGVGAVYAHRGLRRLIYLIRRNARSILTVGGIAIGIFALVMLGSLAEYLNTALSAVMDGGHDKVAVFSATPNVRLGRSFERLIASVPGVRGMVLTGWGGPIDEGEAEFQARGRFWGIESPTGEYGYELPVDVRFAEGRNFTPGSLSEIVIGAGLAESRHLRVGDTLTIRERDFVVVGVWEFFPVGLSDINQRAYMSLDALTRVTGNPNPISTFTALVAPGRDSQQVAQAIEDALPGVETRTRAEQVDGLRQAFTILIAVMAGLLSIAVFVGGVSVVNTMVIAVSERTREIGLKKAVGAADSDILAETLADAAKLGGLGGLIGVLAAWPSGAIINVLTRQSSNSIIILEMTPRLVVGAIVFSTLLGMIAGVLPAWRAARLDPVAALRTE